MWETPIIITLVLFNIVFVAFIVAIVIFIRQYRFKKKLHYKEIETINYEYKKELLKTKIEIQTHTMKHIGQEIHDNVGQKLTLASLYLKQVLHENKLNETTTTVQNISSIIDDSLNELRHLSKSLVSDYIKDNSIFELIKIECEKIENLKKCHINFTCNLEGDIKFYETKSVLFRITQEFLQNSIKHSNCTKIEISLHKTESKTTLILKDNGIGFNTSKLSEGIGLINIKKRAELINGKINLTSVKNKGTELILEVEL